jgi:hypothetical protein
MPLDRLRRISGDELRWRLSVAARTAADRVSIRIRAAQWNRRDLAGILAPAARDLALTRRISAGDWRGVHDDLERRLRARPARFVLDPASARPLRTLVTARWPQAAADARARADRILERRYDLLGYRDVRYARPDGAVNWHADPVHGRQAPRIFHADVPYLDPAVGDHKVIWEINRHQYWLQLGRAAWLTGDARYSRAIVGDLQTWLAANPPLVGINWASMLEIGFRTISWTWGLHCLLGLQASGSGPPETAAREPGTDPGHPQPDARSPWIVDMFVGLHHQLTHVERNLSYYFSPNTHLTGEALALYVVGTAFPELAASARWAATGRRILLGEIDRQIDADGGHAERSTHYQRYTLDFYLLALLTARLAQDREAAARFEDAARRLAVFTQAIADDNGLLPLIGDDDGGMLWPMAGRECHDVRDTLSLAALVLERPALAPWGVMEQAVWVAGPELVTGYFNQPSRSPAGPPGSRAFAGTGYFVSRDGKGGHAVLDGGAHGYMNGGHAHADALSLTLAIDGRPMLIDPGTSTYTFDAALRDRLRSSMSHNTITIDGQSQSIPSGPFHWRTRVDARMHEWRQNAAFDWVEASHDGYAPLQHRRTVMRAGGGWLIADEILGHGHHSVAAHWHFDPAWTVAAEPGRLRATHADGSMAWVAHDPGDATLFHGDNETRLGWFAPVYGVLVPSWTARVAVARDAPFTLLTWAGSDRELEAPLIERVSVQCDAGSTAIAAQVSARDSHSVFLLRPPEPATRAARSCRVADFETDARALHCRVNGGRLVSLDLVDARYATMSRADSVSVESNARMADLHLRIDQDTIDVLASVPPALLRVRGVPEFRQVRLNGRALPLSATPTPGVLLIHGADWRDSALSDSTDPWLNSGAGFAQH